MLFRILSVLSLALAFTRFMPAPANASPATLGRDLRALRVAEAAYDHGGVDQLKAVALHVHEIASVVAERGGVGVAIRLSDGVVASLLPHGVRFAKSPGRLPMVGRFSSQQRLVAPRPRALVLEPFATLLGLGQGAFDPVVTHLQDAGFQVDRLQDTQVSLRALANMHNYNVVFMETHSGASPGGEANIATGEIARDGDPLATSLLGDGSLQIVQVYGGGDNFYYAINSHYIQGHQGAFPANSIVFINGCETLLAPTFWQALQSKGVGALIGWTKDAQVIDNWLTGLAIFNLLGKGESVQNAVQDAKQAGYGMSTYNNEQSVLGFQGDGGLTLADAANPPALIATPPAPKPTSAATATAPATPAPHLTATTQGGPPLTVTLAPRVVPGKMQVIRVTSSADTIVHIRIEFPSGDGRTVTTATDGQGQAKFAFPQHAGRVTFHHVFATVTVQAVHGGTTTRSMRYRIGWSHLDAVVVPRLQAVGKAVWIQVHTAADAEVVARLRFPRGQTLRLVGQAARNGWAQIRYVVGAYLKTSTNHRVAVRVRSVRRGHVYQSRTGFSIQ